ncbi:MAG: CbtB domain-containing protein [Halohasta sp.]
MIETDETDDTVTDRLRIARASTTPFQAATLLTFAAAITFTLVVLQEPLAHDSLHTFRHAAGIVCH